MEGVAPKKSSIPQDQPEMEPVEKKKKSRLRFDSTAIEVRTSVDAAGRDILHERKLKSSNGMTEEDHYSFDATSDDNKAKTRFVKEPLDSSVSVPPEPPSSPPTQKSSMELKVDEVVKEAKTDEADKDGDSVVVPKPKNELSSEAVRKESTQPPAKFLPHHLRKSSAESSAGEVEKKPGKAEERKGSSTSNIEGKSDRKPSKEVSASERLRRLSQAAERDREFEEMEEKDRKRKESLKEEQEKAEKKKSEDGAAEKERRKSQEGAPWDGDRRDPNAKRLSFDGGAARRLSYDAAQREKDQRLSLTSAGKGERKKSEDVRKAHGSETTAGSEQKRKKSGTAEQERLVSAETDNGTRRGSSRSESERRKSSAISDSEFEFQGSLSRESITSDEYNEMMEERLAKIAAKAAAEGKPQSSVPLTAWWNAADIVFVNGKYEPVLNSRERLANNDLICIYFASYITRQSRVLTNFVKRFYLNMKKEGWPIEFIYIPMDDAEMDSITFIQDIGECWLSVPWHDQLRRRHARNQCNVSKHPRLVVLKNVGEGVVLTTRGKQDIQERGEGAWFHWVKLAELYEIKRARRRKLEEEKQLMQQVYQ